jgi:DNA mismatch repair protein MSH6
LEEAYNIQAERKAKGMQLIFAKFDEQRAWWVAASTATAMLDALGSLAKTAQKPGYIRPKIVDCPCDADPTLKIIQGRHPGVDSPDFVPNDLCLGSTGENDSSRILLLSGPNMGGKSTLLRQTCLISIMAQIGSYVPAEICEISPFDCVYTRLGASDKILLGQSTFFVELAETAAALRGATRRSLVIMDELGRGTSTFDGTAIAGATVKHLVERSKCLSLFATHYHSLLDEWKKDPMVRLGHMECLVQEEDGGDENGGETNVVFQYTLGAGTCPKSFGINVARMAGLPKKVLLTAKRVSSEFEEQMSGKSRALTSLDPAKAAGLRKSIEQAIDDHNWDEMRRLVSELKNL